MTTSPGQCLAKKVHDLYSRGTDLVHHKYQPQPGSGVLDLLADNKNGPLTA